MTAFWEGTDLNQKINASEAAAALGGLLGAAGNSLITQPSGGDVASSLHGPAPEPAPASTDSGSTEGGDTGATNGEGFPTATGDLGDVFSQILAGIKAPDTPENRRALAAWQQAEGGSVDNPFNTTQDAPGARSINSVGVRRYSDTATGVSATVQTLENGLYGNIIGALKAGNNAMAVADAIENSPWGTGGLVKRVLGG